MTVRNGWKDINMFKMELFPAYASSDRQPDLAEVLHLSGGRSSAFLLMSLINGGFGTRPNDFVLFENTGAEDITCYDFINQLSIITGMHIHWLEYTVTPEFSRDIYLPNFNYDKFYRAEYNCLSEILNIDFLKNISANTDFFEKDTSKYWYKKNYGGGLDIQKEVNYNTASRNGKPFTDAFLYKCAIRIIKNKGIILPTAAKRWCTGDMKEKTGDKFLSKKGIREHISFKGMRADEPERIAKLKGRNINQDIIWHEAPLHTLGIKKIDVNTAWIAQPIDLGLQNNGTNIFKDVLGNCTYCHLKSEIKKLWLIQNGHQASLFRQMELLANNWNGDIDAMNRQHGTYEQLEKKARNRKPVTLDEILSDVEKEISCFGCTD